MHFPAAVAVALESGKQYRKPISWFMQVLPLIPSLLCTFHWPRQAHPYLQSTGTVSSSKKSYPTTHQIDSASDWYRTASRPTTFMILVVQRLRPMRLLLPVQVLIPIRFMNVTLLHPDSVFHTLECFSDLNGCYTVFDVAGGDGRDLVRVAG
jgi:hypothetical protein